MKKIALLTGANSGVGLATVKGLAKEGFDLILLVRSIEKAEATQNEILRLFPTTKVDYEIADLEDVKSVVSAAENIKMRYSQIDRIINNAGYSPDRIEFTKEGFEKSFVANHLGHFALTTHLLDLLEASGEGRIINVSSGGYAFGKASRMFTKNNGDLSGFGAYADGKLANVLFTKGLTQKLAGKPISAFSLHPGVVSTNFGANFTGFSKVFVTLGKPFMITPEKGASTSLYLATTEIQNIQAQNGEYFDKSKVKSTKHKDITSDNIEMIWQKSADAVKEICKLK
ncbi:MAG: SDR family NAD(P)-dependent oxidoreductase [Leadbetterella sp.]